jgi:ADP-ribose pyrophosphatase YjhB (NUDIX family)
MAKKSTSKSPPSELERWPRPSVTVDVVALTVESGELRVALYKRADPPQRGHVALPGGFMHIDEGLEEAAARVMAQKVGLAGVFLEQLYTFGDLRRDPRGRVVTVSYYALVDARRFAAKRAPAAISARLVVPWPGETGGPVDVVDDAGRALPLFLDHADILGLAVKRLRGKLDYSPVGFQLLPTEFTLRELQEIHEAVRGEPVNKDSFRRRMLASGLLEATGAHEREVAYRPAELYRFTRRSAT